MRVQKEYVPYEKSVTITEHRAPTDKSIELVDQMRDKLKRELIDQFTVDTGFVKASILCFVQPGFANEDWRFVTVAGKFNLNGKDHRFETKIDTEKWRKDHYWARTNSDNEAILKSLHGVLSEAIAGYMMQESQDFLRQMLNVK